MMGYCDYNAYIQKPMDPVNLYHMGGVLHFRIKGTEVVNNIRLVTESPALDMILECGDGVQLTEEGTDFFMCVDHDVYSSARLIVQMSNGDFCEYRTGSLTVKYGTISTAEFTPVFNKFTSNSVEAFVPGDANTPAEALPVYTWKDIDTLCINGVKYSALPLQTDMCKAGFAKADNSKAKPTAPYRVFSPNSIVREDDEYLRIPLTQRYFPDRIQGPMMAISEANTFDFKNLCGAVRLRITGNTTITKINISTVAPGERLAGTCTIDDEGNIHFLRGGSVNSTSLYFAERYTDEQVRVPTEPGFCLPYLVKSDFYICLPPGTYSEGFNIKVVRADGGSVEKTFSGPVTIERNKVYTYEMDVPSLHSKFVTAVCNGKEIQVRCTQLWKGGPYWAELNIGMEDYSGNNWGSKFAWGDNWRMPESKETHPLFDKYYTYYTEAKCWNHDNKDKGYIVVTGDGDYLYDRITVPHGGYWTSTNNSTENAIGWASVIEIDPDYYYGKKELLFVRPVVD